MTPHEDNAPEHDHSMARCFLMALQVLAMAVCACLIARMIMEHVFQLPHEMCVEAPAPTTPPNYVPPG